MNKKIYDRFNESVNYMVVRAKAASIDAKVDCVYAESFAIGALTIGTNEVKDLLLEMEVDLDAVLRNLKKALNQKKKYNEDVAKSNFSELKVSRQIFDICRMAHKVSRDEPAIQLHHMVHSILEVSKTVQNIYVKCGLDYEEFKKNILSHKEVAGTPKRERQTSSKRETKALSTFCVDITAQARNNELDPILAREKEIEEIITVLCRRNKNNPVLLGEPGVGKTACIEGLAQRIVSGTVPKQLMDFSVFSLNVGSMVAGTKYRGDFEERINALVSEIEKSEHIILFIDEIHTIVGAGGASGGSLDASNILKPFLTKNKLKCIGATTFAEFKKYFQKDGALERRFQQVIVDEPSKEQMYQIMAGVKDRLEEYHCCSISDQAVFSVIDLSDRYMSDKNFPDKAIDCLDMACAKNAWKTSEDTKTVSSRDIEMVISERCKIPLEIVSCDRHKRVDKVESDLRDRVIGQDHAITAICRVLRNAYSGVRNPDRPIGNFVFGGPSGTGKTYTAKELTKAILGKESAFIRLDMSEFSEPHSVSKLIGSPPGYVGFSETSVFVDKVRRQPYCVVLLDELEKAHPYVIKAFLQVMSDGIMTDAMGNTVDFKNIILIMTGNFGMNDEEKGALGFDSEGKESVEKSEQDRIVKFCEQAYGAEFINRVDEFVPFLNLEQKALNKIAKINLDEIKDRIEQLLNISCEVKFSEKVYSLLLSMSLKEHGKNATALKRLISKEIEPCISLALLSIVGGDKHTIMVSVKNNEFISNVTNASKAENAKNAKNTKK